MFSIVFRQTSIRALFWHYILAHCGRGGEGLATYISGCTTSWDMKWDLIIPYRNLEVQFKSWFMIATQILYAMNIEVYEL